MDIKQWVVGIEYLKAVNAEPSIPLVHWCSPAPIRLTTELMVLATQRNLAAAIRDTVEKFETQLTWEPIEAWEPINKFACPPSFELATGLEGEWSALRGELPSPGEALPQTICLEVAAEEKGLEVRFQAPVIANSLRELPSLWNPLPAESQGRLVVILWRLQRELERAAQQAAVAVGKTAKDLADTVQSLLSSLILPPLQPAGVGAIPAGGKPIRARGAVTHGAREIETIVLDKDWGMKERQRFPVVDGPRIKKGELELEVWVDSGFSGQVADLVLVAGPLEVALGFTEIKPPKKGEKATAAFRVSLTRGGIKVRDGNLPVDKLLLVIEPSSRAQIEGESNG